MIILESVPFWPCNDFFVSCRIDDDTIAVKLSIESCAILCSHLVHHVLNLLVTFVLDAIGELICVGRVSNALEELNAFFTLQLLKLAVLLDKVLLID